MLKMKDRMYDLYKQMNTMNTYKQMNTMITVSEWSAR